MEVLLLVTMKDPKKVKQGKKLAEFNHRRREGLAQEAKAKENEPNLTYGMGAVIAVGVLGLLGYYIYQRDSSKDNNASNLTPV